MYVFPDGSIKNNEGGIGIYGERHINVIKNGNVVIYDRKKESFSDYYCFNNTCNMSSEDVFVVSWALCYQWNIWKCNDQT